MSITPDGYNKYHKYTIKVIQQPLRARMCGFGDKDRRPIDPPPVVKLTAYDASGQPITFNEVDASRFVVHAALCSPDYCDRSTVINPSSIPTALPAYHHASVAIMSLNDPVKARNLVGVTVSSAYLLRDEHDELGVFFIFHELSVRTEGRFRLRFTLVELSMNSTNTSSVIDNAYSDVFEVYSAKNFPGMTESTELSKALASQGIKISIRKSSRVKSNNRIGNISSTSIASNNAGDDGFDDDDDD
ncbi:hypothetical protein EV182_002727 [Spiromyces aspiralis]|uniref:Uncharacterized protein n=1 Tax=Spiromyces aspiralis TaxID=68401 RepID=A0ACC1HLB8_9FUNG|nr:hypothetical protein EV182_002727 [Spiromyces aspiralis]